MVFKLYNSHKGERKTFLLTADTSRIHKYYSCSTQLAIRTQATDVSLCSLRHVPTIKNATTEKANLILPKRKTPQNCWRSPIKSLLTATKQPVLKQKRGWNGKLHSWQLLCQSLHPQQDHLIRQRAQIWRREALSAVINGPIVKKKDTGRMNVLTALKREPKQQPHWATQH